MIRFQLIPWTSLSLDVTNGFAWGYVGVLCMFYVMWLNWMNSVSNEPKWREARKYFFRTGCYATPVLCCPTLLNIFFAFLWRTGCYARIWQTKLRPLEKPSSFIHPPTFIHTWWPPEEAGRRIGATVRQEGGTRRHAVTTVVDQAKLSVWRLSV
jgi:hypothetical protein